MRGGGGGEAVDEAQMEGNILFQESINRRREYVSRVGDPYLSLNWQDTECDVDSGLRSGAISRRSEVS